MKAKKKYPKSLVDDGLDDILECVDDILESSENLFKRRMEDDDEVYNKSKRKKNNNDIKEDKAKHEKRVKLYGDNEISQDNKYKPPKRVRTEYLEEGVDEDISPKVEESLDKRVRGLINKLAAQTLPFVTSELQKIYSSNSRAQVDASIFNNIETSVLQKNAKAKRKLVAELMLLISYLNLEISQGIGASFVHRLVKKLEDSLVKLDDVEADKTSNNVLCCLISLYTINLISSNVMFEIFKRICSSQKCPKQIELLMVIIRNVSFLMRKDNPKVANQLLSLINKNNFNTLSKESDNSRVRHIVTELDESIAALKNNNANKMSNYGCDIDKDTIESTLKGLIQRTKLVESLSDATYEEILHSPNWYLLETRLGEQDGEEKDQTKKKESGGFYSKREMKICKALGLNKPTEKTIFGALIRSTDFNEASNNIIGFGFNHCSDAMIVCVHLAIHERKYNPFYYNLINTLCKFNRKYKLATKFSIQDKIRTLGRMKQERVEIFKRLCFELIESDAIPITILKAIEWVDMSTSTKEFLEYLLNKLSDLPDGERKKIMVKLDKNDEFVESMRSFINCFMKECKLFH